MSSGEPVPTVRFFSNVAPEANLILFGECRIKGEFELRILWPSVFFYLILFSFFSCYFMPVGNVVFDGFFFIVFPNNVVEISDQTPINYAEHLTSP